MNKESQESTARSSKTVSSDVQSKTPLDVVFDIGLLLGRTCHAIERLERAIVRSGFRTCTKCSEFYPSISLSTKGLCPTCLHPRDIKTIEIFPNDVKSTERSRPGDDSSTPDNV
jgi:hypothetical protein